MTGPTITLEEARAILRSWLIEWRSGDTEVSRAVRLLLASEASAVARIDEAVRVLEPFARFVEKAEQFVIDRALDGGSPVMPTSDFRLKDFRAAAAFLAREKANG